MGGIAQLPGTERVVTVVGGRLHGRSGVVGTGVVMLLVLVVSPVVVVVGLLAVLVIGVLVVGVLVRVDGARVFRQAVGIGFPVVLHSRHQDLGDRPRHHLDLDLGGDFDRCPVALEASHPA